MKAHVGTPAQAPDLDLVRVAQVSTERSVQALEKRIDALQVVRTRHPPGGVLTDLHSFYRRTHMRCSPSRISRTH